MTNPHHFKITATIARARKRLSELDRSLVTYNELAKLELANIGRLENMLAQETSSDIIEEDFTE